MNVFVSYHRSLARWPALMIQRYLAGRGVDVFLDVESISAGRFEAVIMNEIRRREHFVVVFAEGSAARLGNLEDWVAREITLALEEQKNVVPVLVDGARIEEVPESFAARPLLLEQNALLLPHAYADEGLEKLYETYLSNPTIQERDAYLAEERYARAIEAMTVGDWASGQREIEDAIRLSRRPEYYLLLGTAKHEQGQDRDAIAEIEVAMALDPFGWELMNAKFNLLQQIDEMKAAINLPGDWKRRARSLARDYSARILELNDRGTELSACVDAIGALGAMHREQGEGRRQLAVLGDLCSYAPEDMANELHARVRSSPLYEHRDRRDA